VALRPGGNRGSWRALTGALAALALAAVPAPACAAQIAADRAFMVGAWTDNGDCADAATLADDGRFATANGAQGLWHMEAGRLTMTGSSTMILQVTPVDRNTIAVVNPDGTRGRSTRCGDRAGRSPLRSRPRSDPAFLAGRWTDNGDCAAAVQFDLGGRFATHDGAAGRWTLNGDRLTMSGDSATLTIQIVPIDRNAMNVVNADGSLGRSTRC